MKDVIITLKLEVKEGINPMSIHNILSAWADLHKWKVNDIVVKETRIEDE